MSIIDLRQVPKLPWRPGFIMQKLTGDDPTLDCALLCATLEPGGGTSFHTHESDELIFVLEGEIQVRLGDEVHVVGSEHLATVPKGTPHSFHAIGNQTARVFGFLPINNRISPAYLEGGPSESDVRVQRNR